MKRPAMAAAKSTMKRPAAANPTMKRPAAAVQPIMRRPAAADRQAEVGDAAEAEQLAQHRVAFSQAIQSDRIISESAISDLFWFYRAND